MGDDAAERKRKRLEAWRKRQAQQQEPKAPIKVKLGTLKPKALPKKKEKVTAPHVNPFGEDDDDNDDDAANTGPTKNRPLLDFKTEDERRPAKKRRKWDVENVGDALDTFMEKLQDGAMGSVATQQADVALEVNVSGSMMHLKQPTTLQESPGQLISGQTVTPEQLALLSAPSRSKKSKDDSRYTPSDWESASEAGTDIDEDEEKARREFMEALKAAPAPQDEVEADEEPVQLETAAQVRTEKQRREDRLRQLEVEATAARQASQAAPEFGRMYNDAEGGVMEEAERNLSAATAAPDALEVLAELNKKKELKSVDHSKIDYINFRKNLYIVPRSVANLTNDEIVNRRAKLKIRVRGHGAPAPVSYFHESGLSERIVQILESQSINEPYPVQAQCIPCVMAGRDVIGIAKTGSGKTLAYLLPLLRHIVDQPPLEAHESGPIGLVLAPARELAVQIHSVCKVFCKHLGLKSTVVYGGAAVAEQIGDLKRGVHIAVATPGRLIDLLTMQSGKLLSLQRVTYVCLDEADRIFDMGFSSQIGAILAAIRPDRQIVLFSATFPKTVEQVARKALKYPIEVIVGGRSVASDSVTQYGEVVEEDEKFLRLLQLLGEYVDDGKKVIVFVGTQVKADGIFEQLMRCGYVSLSLHGGKDQEDRDSTISDFKSRDGPGVLVATAVAGRGLDVSSCKCVINYSSPNHLEAYVHQVGRCGRAGKKGFSFTFVNSTDEAMYAPIITRAMTEAGQAENISPALKELSDAFKEKVKRGEAKFAGSGFKGKGYSYDSNELSEAQQLARADKRQALIDAGLMDADEEEPVLEIGSKKESTHTEGSTDQEKSNKAASAAKAQESNIVVPEKLTPELLALPGMREAILKKAGIFQAAAPSTGPESSSSKNQLSQLGPSHFATEFEINDYPREARWKVTQKDTTSRLQDEFRTAVTLKGSYYPPGKSPEGPKDRRLYLHLEAKSEIVLKNCVQEIQRLLNDETLRVSARGSSSSSASAKYSVL